MKKPGDSEGGMAGKAREHAPDRGRAMLVAATMILGIIITGGLLITALFEPAPTATPKPAPLEPSRPENRSVQSVVTQEVDPVVGLDPHWPMSSPGRIDRPIRRQFIGLTGSKAKFWWEGVPNDVQRASLDTGELSNLRPGDYAGPQSCADCHKRNHGQWSKHSHRWMNAPANRVTVKGDFVAGTGIDYYGGRATFFVDGDRYMMQLVRGKLQRTYQVTQTIGSRFFQYYVGVQTQGPEPEPHVIYEKEHLLPFGYWIDYRQWLPVVHVQGARDGESSPTDDMRRDPYSNPQLEFYAETCANCHTTLPVGDWMVRHMGGFNRKTPRRFDFSVASYLQEVHPNLLASELDPGGVSDEEIQGIWNQVLQIRAPRWQVTSGISCEACHNGAKTHVEDEEQLPLFFPVSPHLHIEDTNEEDPLGRTPTNANWTCGRCHTGKRAEFAAGMATWNSVEFDDAYKGGCYTGKNGETALTCIDCHDPHKTIGRRWPRTPTEDDQSCLRCHEQFADRPARMAHTHHPWDSTGSRCMDCHMPRLNEGLQDLVRTHMIFSPTNAKMIEANQPNACNMCHVDQTIDWTLGYLEAWYGKSYSRDKLATNVDPALRHRPATIGWLNHWHASTQTVAVDALTRANARWALPELIPMLDSEYMLVRQFTMISLQKMLNASLDDFGYRVYMFENERSEPLHRIWSTFLPKAEPYRPRAHEPAGAKLERELQRCRGMVRIHPESPQSHFQLGQVLEKRLNSDEAMACYHRVLALKPDYAGAHFALGNLYKGNGDKSKAVLHYRRGLDSEPLHIPAMNSLAWILATSRDDSLRNGPEAIRRAEHAAATTSYRSFAVLDTLAAAYAEAGQFTEAVHWQNKALELAPKRFQAGFQSRLDLYRQSKAYRDPMPDSPEE